MDKIYYVLDGNRIKSTTKNRYLTPNEIVENLNYSANKISVLKKEVEKLNNDYDKLVDEVDNATATLLENIDDYFNTTLENIETAADKFTERIANAIIKEKKYGIESEPKSEIKESVDKIIDKTIDETTDETTDKTKTTLMSFEDLIKHLFGLGNKK